jgi:Asp-tRNA(Asn)/Glu-tRNA(Gln) amidotransferase A subunit family amidase
LVLLLLFFVFALLPLFFFSNTYCAFFSSTSLCFFYPLPPFLRLRTRMSEPPQTLDIIEYLFRALYDHWLFVPLALLVLVALLTYNYIQTKRVNVAKRAEQARRQRDVQLTEMSQTIELLQRQGGMPTSKERAYIASLTAMELWRAMHDPQHKRLSCRSIMLHYIANALDSQHKYTCLAQIRFADALADADKVDTAIASRRRGERLHEDPAPLEGVPLSIKDDYDQGGFDNTCGLAARCGRPLLRNGLMVDLLCDAGAIPFCRSSTPQALLLPESMSAAWGRAKNPYNTTRTSGGSSGGEAALLASRGSPLGVGSDIGGSLRNPAAFCGLYAFKATPERLSLEGSGEPNLHGESGQHSVRASCGPMGHSVDDLELVLRAWLTERMWQEDSTVPRLPLLSASTQKLLRVGYYTDDGYFAPNPACARAVDEAVEHLVRAGHSCTLFTPPLVTDAVGAYYEIMSADNCLGMIAGLEGEEPCAEYKSLLRLTRIPRWVGRYLLAPILQLVGEPRLAQLLYWSEKQR